VILALALLAAACQLATAEPMTCSWYGPGFDGRRTASGEIFDRREMTAAHRSLPFGTRLIVCADRCVEVRINDRGPFVAGRDLDLSEAAFAVIADTDAGLVRAWTWRAGE
jgi:rare lipoprotein A